MKDRLDSFLDKIYEHRGFYLRYFLIAAVLGALRYLLGAMLAAVGFKEGDSGIVAWFLWAVAFYAPVKLWAFKNRCANVYYLMTQMAVYTICVACLWLIRNFVMTGLVLLSNNPAVAIALGGVITELVCLAFMINLVFKKKKS